MHEFNADKLLENTPVPVPSVVFVVNATVGFSDVLQQIPRAVTAPPPSLVMFPPDEAEVLPIPVIAVVVMVAKPTGGAEVVKLTWLP